MDQRAQVSVVEGVGTDNKAYRIEPLVWSVDKMKELWARFAQVEVFTDDGPQDLQSFVQYVLTNTAVWFVIVEEETGEEVGLIFVDTFIRSPLDGSYLSAQFHAMIWDAKAAPRRSLAKPFFVWLFKTFGLHRLESVVPATHGGAIRNLRRMGFSDEGLKRESVRYGGVWVNTVILSLLDREVLE